MSRGFPPEPNILEYFEAQRILVLDLLRFRLGAGVQVVVVEEVDCERFPMCHVLRRAFLTHAVATTHTNLCRLIRVPQP